jgi:hypothetical protein
MQRAMKIFKRSSNETRKSNVAPLTVFVASSPRSGLAPERPA